MDQIAPDRGRTRSTGGEFRMSAIDRDLNRSTQHIGYISVPVYENPTSFAVVEIALNTLLLTAANGQKQIH